MRERMNLNRRRSLNGRPMNKQMKEFPRYSMADSLAE
jgi:hypothetical protein